MCRQLNADEIECRVATVSEKGCSLLLYKTARVDRTILDETFGALNWQNDFKVIDGKMYGGIGISRSVNGTTEWVWKWDCGVESNTEQEKGQASDAFKRAGFKWGIGVELYTAPFIFANVPTVFNKAKNKWELENKFEKFDVKSITYKDGVIDNLEIINSKGETVYKKGQYIKQQEPKKPIKKTAAEELFPEKPLKDDSDVYTGLVAIVDEVNLYKYFDENKNNVNDIAAFKEACKLRKGVINNGK